MMESAVFCMNGLIMHQNEVVGDKGDMMVLTPGYKNPSNSFVWSKLLLCLGS